MPNKKNLHPHEDEDEAGRGGKSGEIEFRYKDAFSGPTRDDLLPPNEMKRLMIVHKDTHKMRVDKQKQLREERLALKEGNYIPNNERVNQKGFGVSGGGASSRYKKHPISDKAYFSGKDKQVIGVPTLNESNTNSDLKDKLENQLENKYQNTPKFNPKPRYPGS